MFIGHLGTPQLIQDKYSLNDRGDTYVYTLCGKTVKDYRTEPGQNYTPAFDYHDLELTRPDFSLVTCDECIFLHLKASA